MPSPPRSVIPWRMTTGAVALPCWVTPAGSSVCVGSSISFVRTTSGHSEGTPLPSGTSWATHCCFALSKSVSGKKAEVAYEFVNWFLSGWAGAYLNRQGYYSAVLPTAKAAMEPYEWAFWMEGQPAEKDIHAPDGSLLEKAGTKRDGGS